MARKLRYEAPGAIFHVFNRGNYRAHIFVTEGAKRSFLMTLDEACRKAGWVVPAWALMNNHYHLAVITEWGNLVEGVQWLQSTFAARFNRFRREHGHLFQGRYKALPVESGEYLGALCSYIQLNPVRAHLVGFPALRNWPWTSYRWLHYPELRRSWYDPLPALESAGGLADTAAGRQLYDEYLAWLIEDDDERHRLGFERMCSGWALGSDAFKRDLLAANNPELGGELQAYASPEAVEGRSMAWSAELARLKAILGVSGNALDQKLSADWKVALATAMKDRTTASNRWLAEQLGMGSPFAVSRLATECRKRRRAIELYRRLTAKRKP